MDDKHANTSHIPRSAVDIHTADLIIYFDNYSAYWTIDISTFHASEERLFLGKCRWKLLPMRASIRAMIVTETLVSFPGRRENAKQLTSKR